MKSKEEKLKKPHRRPAKQDLERVTGKELEKLRQEKLPQPVSPPSGPSLPVGGGELDFEP